jgi:hypothetical protein
MATFQDREWGDPTSFPQLFHPTALVQQRFVDLRFGMFLREYARLMGLIFKSPLSTLNSDAIVIATASVTIGSIVDWH